MKIKIFCWNLRFSIKNNKNYFNRLIIQPLIWWLECETKKMKMGCSLTGFDRGLCIIIVWSLFKV